LVPILKKAAVNSAKKENFEKFIKITHLSQLKMPHFNPIKRVFWLIKHFFIEPVKNFEKRLDFCKRFWSNNDG
jgi:hypothetical protein